MFGLHQAEAQDFLKICSDQHQGLSSILRGQIVIFSTVDVTKVKCMSFFQNIAISLYCSILELRFVLANRRHPPRHPLFASFVVGIHANSVTTASQNSNTFCYRCHKDIMLQDTTSTLILSQYFQ
jgi:hypothetical protein